MKCFGIRDETIRYASTRGDDDDNLMALCTALRNALGDSANAIEVFDGRAAILLYD